MNISHKDTKVPTKAQRRVSPFFVPSALTLRLCVNCLLLVFLISAPTFAQHPGSRTSRAHPTMSAEAKALLDEAIGVVCTQAKLDPKSSIAIDEMQARPSLPLQSPEARADASVYLSRPHMITFGTIFLAGLRSDEGMISVLAHELMHIADGDNDSLRPLVSAVGSRASDLTGLEIHGQRSEEVTCDLIGAMAVRAYITSTPGYESIARRIARSIQHNCVELDEGDEDHLSPRNTIRALLALNPVLVRELISDREERKLP